MTKYYTRTNIEAPGNLFSLWLFVAAGRPFELLLNMEFPATYRFRPLAVIPHLLISKLIQKQRAEIHHI
jgi:hypothetical protein